MPGKNFHAPSSHLHSNLFIMTDPTQRTTGTENSEPLLSGVRIVDGPTNVMTLANRKAKSFWVFVVLAIGVFGFLFYSSWLILFDALAGSYDWVDIDKPTNDPKIYKYLPELLPNAPPIVVVQDPGAQLTGFAIGVSAGAYYDPVDYPGLAHFTEHMLFLGTEKYPGPTAFDEFISSHGGSSNAFTDSERTVYYNTIDTDVFQEGFSRFIEFFTRPVFNETYVEKEVNAVDSEHDMHLNDPHWRLFSAISSLSLPPVNHYSTGDSTTLLSDGVPALENAVRKYFASNYCFNRMSIAIVSPLPVSDQVEMVRDVFSGISSPIPRNCRAPTNFTRASQEIIEAGGVPISVDNRQKLVYSQGPAGNVPIVWIAFPYKAIVTNGHGGKHPFGILEMILTYNGQASLRQTLISSGLITSMSFMYDDSSAGSLGYISYDVSNGARDRVDVIISTTFAFINKLREQGGVTADFVEGIRQLRESLFYSNAESGSIVNESPMRLSKYFATQLTLLTRNRAAETLNARNAVDLISINEKILEADVPLVNDVLDHLTVDNSVILVHDPKYSSTTTPDWVTESTKNFASVTERTDPHYGFKFKIANYSDSAKAVWAKADLAKDIPIFTAVAVLPPSIVKTVPGASWNSPRTNTTIVMAPPTEIFKATGVEIWYKPSALAKGSGKVWLWATVKPVESVVSQISIEELQFHGEMLVDCVTFELRSKVADFILAGYDFTINWMTPGYYEIKVSGWQDRIKDLMEIVVGGISTPNLKYFDLILGEKKDALSRSRAMSDVAGEALNSLVVGSPTRDDIKTYVNTFDLKKDDLVLWSARVFRQVYFAVYVAGDKQTYPQEEAAKLGKGLVHTFNKESLLADRTGAVLFNAGPRFAKPVEVRMMNPNANDPNGALLYSLTYGSDMSARDRVIAALLATIVDPLIFRTIRTEYQMGYIASGKVGVYPGPAGAVQFRVYIQGNVANPDLMEARLEELFTKIPAKLEAIPLSEITERAEGLSASLEEIPNSAHAEVSQFWQSIHDQSGCFTRGENQSNFLKTTDAATLKEDIVNVFNQFWAERRSKVAVKVWKSEGTNPQVDAWDAPAINSVLGNSTEVVTKLQAERQTATLLGGISKHDRETAFQNAVNTSDPMWEPTIVSCEV